MMLASLVLLLPWWLAVTVLLTYPFDDSVGIDRQITGPGPAPRVIAGILAIITLALPPLTLRWARKKWLGYLLLGLALSGVGSIAGLVMIGVL